MESPYRRDVAPACAIWTKGAAQLLDYGIGTPAAERIGSVALFIPSLINRYYILDLEENRSMLRYMASEGIYPLVLDWGTPGPDEADYDVGAYIEQVLLPAIAFLQQTTGKPISLVGYCMGGILAMAAARLIPDAISNLSLLATPWDFHCKEFQPFVVEPQWHKTISSLLSQGALPAEVIQSLFYLTDPWVFEQKFRRFAQLQADSRAAKDFIALEQWVNDGVPMTAGVAQDCLLGWVQHNQLMKNAWRVMDTVIDPRKIKTPTLIAIPRNDHVVPYDCAAALPPLVPNAQIMTPPAGHVGMIVGGQAKKELWQPLVQWIAS
ncbi:MAG: alpha/beta fold hydrolase [Rickettsiales bacterium]|nr:alpha/beta fold hydrolase [Rickettsiales bacterium]